MHEQHRLPDPDSSRARHHIRRMAQGDDAVVPQLTGSRQRINDAAAGLHRSLGADQHRRSSRGVQASSVGSDDAKPPHPSFPTSPSLSPTHTHKHTLCRAPRSTSSPRPSARPYTARQLSRRRTALAAPSLPFLFRRSRLRRLPSFKRARCTCLPASSISAHRHHGRPRGPEGRPRYVCPQPAFGVSGARLLTH
ncbi:uncharacterized protein K452DRAFT_23041 [Aplosporella prunicola CBS 121167]|uniref:Uncharacterized protein n=1 Tax=Aplosporella prunicola CBS 121167 TaxID=1176127 RepID=A0A6A6AWP0_9PEZI|nr:uncharacterized protein K452DRAFT_23041 [Aplosporella prunicola CBS 121167]KAF2135395.1 hypothetical protein K452DRAFT_23041 [Aplosporella prunicola CBS 121167]